MLLGVSYIVDTYSYAILYHNCAVQVKVFDDTQHR